MRQLARAQHALAASDLPQAILQALMLAMGWLLLHDIREAGVAGINPAVPQGSRMGMLIWPQVLELDDGALPAAALRFLLGHRLPEITPQDLAQLQALEDQALDADLARGISATLVAEAAAHPAYAPEGRFRLELPAAYPLAAATRRLRLWVTADRLWCAPEGAAGVIGMEAIITDGKTMAAILLGLVGLGVVTGVIYALYLIGAETIRTVVYILAVPAGLALILLAAAPVIRAWRTNIQPEKQVYHHTRETRYVPVPDARLAPPAPTLPQLPAQAAGPAYP